MAIKINNSTIIDDGRNIVNAGIATIATKIDVGVGGTIFSADANISSDNILSVKNTSQNPAFDITGIGSVGIGVTNPSKSLHVDGTGVIVSSGNTTLFSVETFTPNSNILEVDTNKFVVGAGGSVGIGTTNPISTLDVRGDIKVGIDTSQGLILTSPNGTTFRLVVDNSGNLSAISTTL